MKKNDKDILEYFGEMLKKARLEPEQDGHVRTQREMAQEIKKFTAKGEPDHNAMYQLEAGKRMPTRQELDYFCNYLNRTEEYFFPIGTPVLRIDKNHRPMQSRSTYEGPYNIDKDKSIKVDYTTGIITKANDYKEPVFIPVFKPVDNGITEEERLKLDKVVEDAHNPQDEVAITVQGDNPAGGKESKSDEKEIPIQIPVPQDGMIMPDIELNIPVGNQMMSLKISFKAIK